MRLKFTTLGLAVAATALGQNVPPANQPVTIRTSVQLVTIPVVVRDKQGHASGNLEKGAFQLFDNGKRQEISVFSVEKSGAARTEASSSVKPPEAAAASAPRPTARPAPDILPDRFVGYLFDDIHMKASDIMRVRKVADAHFASSLRPGDRGAVFTTSGVLTVDFTSDHDALRKALARLMPRPMTDENPMACPQISYYQADLIANRKDPMAIRTAMGELMSCATSMSAEEAVNHVNFDARAALIQGEREGQTALGSFLDVVRHMEVLPGQRTLILLSPGFLTPDLRREVSGIIHAAIQSRVTVSALDARGLWVDPVYDLSSPASNALRRGGSGQSAGGLPSGADIARNKSFFASSAAWVASDVMAEISAGTGGRLFHDSNDLKEGLEQIAAAPEYVYMLAFSPGDVKLDGKYHNIKVTLRNGQGLTVDARRGYYAPAQFANPVEQAKNDIRDAVFSRDELNDLPVDVMAQFLNNDATTGKIVVQARVYPQSLKLRKADGRNYGQVRMACSVFDPNGRYVKAIEKVAQLQIRDDILDGAREKGIVLRGEIDVDPGRYLVRVVIRDVEGQQTTARNVIVGDGQGQ